MMRGLLILCVFFLPWALSVTAEPWVRISVDEIQSASPIQALAAMPVRLATAVYNALPRRYHEDAREWGFDVEQISRDIERLPVGKETTIVRGTVRVHVAKFERKEPDAVRPTSLAVSVNGTTVNCPLLFTGAAVRVLAFLYKDLRPVRDKLRIAIDHVKIVPPGRLLWCTDQSNTLEISLK